MGFTICVLGALFWLAQAVLAFDLPQIYVTDYGLDKTSVVPGSKTDGSVTLWNYDQAWASDLSLGYQLMYGAGGSRKTIDVRGGDTFSLAPGEKRTFNFTYWMPYKLPTGGLAGAEGGLAGAEGGLAGAEGGLAGAEGEFVLRVRVENSLGTVLAWSDKRVYCKSDGKFFNLDYLADLTSLNPGVLASGESPEVRFVLTRSPRLERPDLIAQTIRFTTAREGNETWREQELPLEYDVSERETITYRLPAFGEPGRYKTTVKVVSKGTGDVFSNSLEFYWVVKGPQGNAQIFFAALDKSAYTAEAIAVLRVGFAAQNFNEGTGGDLAVVARILDGAGEPVGDKTESVKMTDREVSMRIPVQRDVGNPRITLQLVSGGRVLSAYGFFAQDQKNVQAEKKIQLSDPVLPGFWSLFFTRFSLYISIFSGVILAGAAVYYFKALRPAMRKKRKAKETRKAPKKTAGTGESIGDLLDQFNEIDKINRRFKTPK